MSLMHEPDDTAAAAAGDFHVIAREPGAEHPALPTWANRSPDPLRLQDPAAPLVTLREVRDLPGGFQLFNVLSGAECRRFIDLTEALGYLPDAAVSLPRSIRHNDNLTWVADDDTVEALWRRCAVPLAGYVDPVTGKRALGLNARFRFYRYGPGDYFAPHTDGAWPGSRVVGGELIGNAYPDRYSRYSLILLLSEGFSGGGTAFYLDPRDPTRPHRGGTQAAVATVTTPLGAALCFPHGTHPLHCVHASEPIVSGTKYIVRTDILFEI